MPPYLLLQLWAAMCGTRDGSLLIPHGQDPSPWIMSCWAGAQAGAQRIAMGRARAESRLAARRESLRFVAADASDMLHKAEAAEARCAEQREAVLLRAEQARQTQGNPMGHGLPTWGYVLAVVALCSLEFPLVYLSFTTFGLEPVYTFLLAALCAALTGFLGHAVGTLSRNLRVSTRLVLGLILLGSLAFIASLAYLRESAMAALNSDTLTLNPGAAALALFGISSATLVAAALLAWHHRVEPLAHEIARSTRALHRAHRRSAKAHVRLLRITGRELQAVQGLKEVRTLAERRVHALNHRTRKLMHTYASANIRARDEGRLPDALRDENLPTVQLPDDKE